MKKVRFGNITAAKDHFELLDNHTKSVHSAPYQAGLLTRKFEKAEIDKMPKEEFIEPAQTERATPIVFSHQKDGSLRF